MHPREKAAIAATLSDAGLLDRVRAVAGRDVGDPLNNAQDSVALREQFDLTVEFTHSSVMAFNDDGVCATLRCYAPDSQQWSRRVACVAVASMWTPAIGKAARAASAQRPEFTGCAAVRLMDGLEHKQRRKENDF